MAIQDFWQQKLSRHLREKVSRIRDAAALCPVVIECRGPGVERLIARIENNRGRIYREIGLIPSIAVELPLGALAELARAMGVTRIWDDAIVYAMLDRTASNLGASLAQESGYTGNGVVVAVLDTGIFPHDDLVTPENRILAWYDLLGNGREPYDDNGHGTHVAGIIAGNGASSQGRYRGMAPEAHLVGVKVLNRDGTGRLSDLITGLEWCLAHQETLNIKVINLSLGTGAQGDYTTDLACRATTKAVQRGITVCSSFGRGTTGGAENRMKQPNNSPSINPNIIAVGNYDAQKTFSDDEILDLENPGPALQPMRPDLVVPGAKIVSLKVNGGYRTLSGASMAAPLVSGAVALVLQKWPNLPPERIKWLLKRNARNLGYGTNLQGAGALNLEPLFAGIRKSASRQSESPKGSSDGLLETILNVIGPKLFGSGLGGDLLTNILTSLVKSFKSLYFSKRGE